MNIEGSEVCKVEKNALEINVNQFGLRCE